LEENAIWVAVCLTGTTIVRLLLQWKAAREVLPSLRLKFSTFSWQVIGSVGSFSLIAFISQLSGLLYWHTDRLVINHCLTPLDLTLYSVATSLAIYVYDLTQVPTSVFFPVLAGLEATGNLAQIPPLLVRGTRLCIIVSLPFCIIFSTLAEPLFLLYLGPAYQGAGLFVPIVMVSVLSSSSTCFLRQVPTAIGKPGFISFIEITFALINLALTLIFVIRFHWGLAGVAWGTTIATVIKNWIVIPWYLTSLVGLNLRQLARQVFQGILPSSLIGLILIPIIFYVPLLQWKVWFSLFAGLGPIYFLLVYFLSLEGTDKALLKKILSGITFRFSCLNK
jgi:O-antigen/teichoic acid export membrane protein